jgi:hypothetical protein
MKTVEEASHLPWPGLVSGMIEAAGRKLTAYIAGLADVRSLEAWTAGEKPGGDVEDRLRLAYEIVCLIRAHDSARVAQAWLTGINPELGDQVPLRLLREGELDTVGPRIRGAAMAFVVSG